MYFGGDDCHFFYIYLGSDLVVYKINLVCVGDLKETFYKECEIDFLKRLKHFATLNIIELPPIKLSNNPSQNEINNALLKEAELIKKCVSGKVFVLAKEGKTYTSEDFCRLLFSSFDRASVTFVIGSSYGLDEAFKKSCEKISFSKMTFPHHLFRIMLEEQIYRAFTIKNNITYHK